jgi:hypothetical protein
MLYIMDWDKCKMHKRKKKTHKLHKNSSGGGLISRIKQLTRRARKKFTNMRRRRAVASRIEMTPGVLNQKLLDTALYGASTEEVRKLIRDGADVRATMNDGRSVIQIARDGEHQNIVDVLRSHGEHLPLDVSMRSVLKSPSRRRSPSRRAAGRSVNFGKNVTFNISPKGKQNKTPSRQRPSPRMTTKKIGELDIASQRFLLASKRGH